MKSLAFILLFAFLSVLLFIGFSVAFFYLPPATAQRTVEVQVDPGETFSSVVRKLRDEEVILNKPLFLVWAKALALDKKVHWGHYRFELPLAPSEVLDRMVQGKGLYLKVTVPEGLTVVEIASVLQQDAAIKREEFLLEADNPELLAELSLSGKGLEGYLFPDTYYFPPMGTARDVLRIMVGQFRKKLQPLIQKPITEIHDVVTLASLIEKETGIDAERPLISAVFHNRLKSSMPLQSDPTVIYGLSHFSGDLTRKDLRDPSPYNTYRIQGLPPGPICNPGLPSLLAAIHPAPVPYLYFVSKNDGSHEFSVTLEDHNRAVKNYQIDGARPARR